MGLERFDYSTYKSALEQLVHIPETMKDAQEKLKAKWQKQIKAVEEDVNKKVLEIEGKQKLADEQYNAVSFEYKALFNCQVSRPQPMPSPLRLADTMKAQTISAQELKKDFDSIKSAAREEKNRLRAEEEEKQRMLAKKMEDDEMERKRREEEEQLRREEEYRKQMERENSSFFQRLIYLITGK